MFNIRQRRPAKATWPQREQVGAGAGDAKNRARVLAGCILASSTVFIDATALPVALPRLRSDFGVDLTSIQWVVNAYMLALASLTLIGGALADTYGKVRVLVLGCACFGVASALCALSPSCAWLISARVAQGVAAAVVAPTSLALISSIYSGNERTRAISIWAAASALTTSAGPVLGGWLTENFGWASVFWMNPPVAILAIAFVSGAEKMSEPVKRRFDFAGAAILASSLAAVAWLFSELGGAHPADRSANATSAGFGLSFAAAWAIAGLLLYVVWERRISDPMTPPRMARNRVFVSLNAATFVIYAAVSIMFFVVPFDLIDRRGDQVTTVGLTFLPFSLSVGLLSGVFDRVTRRFGRRAMLILAPSVAAVGYLWMAIGQQQTLVTGVIVPMAVLGIAFAMLVSPLTSWVLSCVEPRDEGLASGINNAVSRVAQLSGTALASGLTSYGAGFQIGLCFATILSIGGILIVVATIPAEVRANP